MRSEDIKAAIVRKLKWVQKNTRYKTAHVIDKYKCFLMKEL